MLHWLVQGPEGQEMLQLVLPREQQALALQALHDDFGLMGKDQTLAVA